MPNNDVIAALSLQVGASTVRLRSEMDAAAASTRASARVMKESFAEGRAGIKQLGEEIGINLNRHLVSFLAKLPGVAPVMAAAFPVAAVAGIGMALYEAGKRVAEFIEKNREAASAISDAMEKITRSTAAETDQIELTNVKLAAQIAKLEDKPANQLAIALAEARVEADHLAESLKKDLDGVDKLIKEHAVSPWGGAMTGQADTGWTAGKVGEFKQALESIDDQKVSALRALTDPSQIGAVTAKFDELWLKKAKEARDWAAGQWNTMKADQVGMEGHPFANPHQFDAQMAITSGYGHQLDADIDKRGGELETSKLQQRLQGDQGKAAAAQQAAEAARQAAAEWMREWSYQLRRSRPFEEVAKNAPKYFAEQRANVPENVVRADEELNKLMIEQAEDVLHVGERWADFNREQAKGNEELARATSEAAALRTRIDLARGAISAYDAAQMEATQHLAEYTAEHKALSNALTRVQGDSSLNEVQRQTQSIQLRNQMQSLGDRQKLQSMMDAQAIHAASALGKLQESTNSLISGFTDLGAMASRTLIQSLNSLNETIVKILSSRAGSMQGEHPWRQLGGGVFREATNSGLQYAEGSLMKAFGIGGKKGDSAGNPLWVSIAGGASAAGQGIGSGIGSIFSKIGSIFHLPGFAEGGMVTAGVPILVGEHGPEPFVPSTAGRVIPHSQMGGGNQTIHIDARGASDPAAVQAAVARSMAEYLPHLKSHAVAAIRDDRQRRPSRGR